MPKPDTYPYRFSKKSLVVQRRPVIDLHPTPKKKPLIVPRSGPGRAIALGLIDAGAVAAGSYLVAVVDEKIGLAKPLDSKAATAAESAMKALVQTGIALGFAFVADWLLGESDYARMGAAGGFGVPLDTLVSHIKRATGVAESTT